MCRIGNNRLRPLHPLPPLLPPEARFDTVRLAERAPAGPRAVDGVGVEEVKGAVEAERLLAPQAVGQRDVARAIARIAGVAQQDRLVRLAAFAGALAAPIYSVSPVMGSNILIVVFAVVVIGGMGSIAGAVVTGLMMGVVEGFTKVFYPEGSAAVIFLVMVVVLLIRPSGLFGKEA